MSRPDLLHLKSRQKPVKPDVWTTEIRVKLRGRGKTRLRGMIPGKLLNKLAEAEE